LKLISEEAELFDWLKENYYPDLTKAKNPASRWDCYSPERKHRIELKCRRTHYPELMIQKDKYDAVIKECSKHNDVPVYINSTPKGVYAFDMRKHNGIWELRSVPKTTYFNDFTKVTKEVGYFDITKGHTLLKFN